MKKLYFILACLSFSSALVAQTNIQLTNPTAHEILLGNFNPADYAPSTVIDAPGAIAQALAVDMDTDSLYAYLQQMSAFENRNTGSDTISTSFGMGAARRWAFDKFTAFSAAQEDRLVVSYLQFDQNICGMGQHRNILAILPGQGPQFNEVVLVEGHFDSRCEENCDLECMAHGMEDNGSGSALVLELTRVMARFSFNRTLVFMLTTGEEQGLHGARAFAQFAQDEQILLNAVFNNDIVGGIICGATASPPGCPGLNDIDSINVRIYSLGNVNSKHKQLA
ncbi:MAG: M28 family peptidase, partial [Phaeodactylibacter sp.]|nr:M28 family peptidase [Phaeodactylibacter sp.]